MIFSDFSWFQVAKTENTGFNSYVWSCLKGSEWGGGQEINARNEELSMSRRAQYILESPNSKNS